MSKDKERLKLGPVNYIILGGALLLLIIGYIIIAKNEIAVSPLILVIAYAIVIPFGILYKGKPKE